MRILIVSYYFAPYNTIGAVRMTKTVKYLERLGHDVRVISAKDQPLPKNLPLESNENNIIRTKWLSLQKVISFFYGGKKKVADNGYQLSNKRPIIRMLASSYKAIFHFPDGNIGWYPFAVKAGKRLMNEWKPDVILASGSPFTSFLVAKRLSAKYNVPWVADFRDLWVDNANYTYSSIRKRLEQWLEKWTITSCESFITVSEPLANQLRRKYSKDVEVITNGFDEEDYCDECYDEKLDKKVTIVYTGMVYEKKQDIKTLFTALSNNEQLAKKVKIHFYGRGLHFIKSLCTEYSLHGTVEVHSPIGHREIMNIQQRADVLLLLLWNDEKQKGVYTGKLFEYIGARRPILAIGKEGNVATDLINETSRGVVVANEDQIVMQLQEWVEERKKGRMRHLAPLLSKGLTRKEQTLQFLSLFSKVTRKYDEEI